MRMSLLIAGTCAVLLSVAGGLLTDIGPWYRQLRKPSWQPPNWLFGPAWTIILGLAAWSGALAWTTAPDASSRTMVLVLFGINASLHLLWTPLFFTYRRPDWALKEVVFLWISIVAIIGSVGTFSPLASLLLVPYIAWVTFAAWLNRAVVRLNRPFTS